MKLKEILTTEISSYLKEDKNEISSLKKELINIDKWFVENNYSSAKWKNKFNELDILRAEQEEKARLIRIKLFNLTGDYYGETKDEINKKKIKPKGVESSYDHPGDVPKEVYRWLSRNSSLLNSDATDAVRFYRIINTRNEQRYPEGEIEIYRAVENRDFNEIRPGDWITTEEKYANKHNQMYFNGKGNVISTIVNGRDVLISPTGDREEAIYAPLEYSIDIKY